MSLLHLRHRCRAGRAMGYCLAAAALAVAGPAYAQGTGSASPAASALSPDAAWVEQTVEPWFRETSRRTRGEWGIAIADQNGRLLWGQNPDTPMVPASTLKVFTTGFARSVLGTSARRPTRVIGTGTVNPTSGEWVGSWGLELNGDPSLERGDGEGPTLYDLALQLASAGIRRLSGPLHVQSADGDAADAVYPSAWSPHHRGRTFAPLIGPLTLHENVVWVTVEPGSRTGARARIIGAAPDGITSLISVRATTGAGRRSRLALQPRSDGGWTLTGTIGRRARLRTVGAPMRDPKAVLSAAWARALQRAGIEWNAKAQPEIPPVAPPRVLAEVSSPPLDSLVSEVNRRSLNYGAELLLQWAGGREAGPQRLAAHVLDVTGTAPGLAVVDGSGLSFDNRVAPSTFVSYLAKYPLTPAGRNFPQLLPANGTGTLRRLGGFPASGVVRAKTGTLGNTASVVGYLGRPEGTLIVALIYNGPRQQTARQAQWRLFRALGADGVSIPSDSVPEALEPALGDDPAGWAEGQSGGGAEGSGDEQMDRDTVPAP